MCSPAKNLEFLKRRRQAGCRTKIVPQSRKSPARTLQCHVGIQDARTDIAHFGILIEEIRQSIQTARKHDHVRIHQRDIASLALPDGDVVAFGEAEILAAPDELDLGKSRFDHFRGAIARSIVHHKDFHAAAGRRSGQTFEAQFQIVLGIPADDDN